MRTAKTIALWLVTILLAALFVLTGINKFTAPDVWIERMQVWGYPSWFRPLIGLVEIAAGIMTVVPKTAFYGAGALAAVMLGAFVTHLRAGEMTQVPFVGVLFVLLAMVAWVRRGQARASASGTQD